MTDSINSAIANEEQSAARATADENTAEIRKEYENPDNDNNKTISKPINSSSTKSNDNNKKEPPQMNIQLQH
ncbi:unnamed protein product [Rotaria sp. Silwood1]|nr:unnamed protein product [Rotaria sp. Silwood1]CAF1570709.1 unnamed protein product [Rotaria sp. Silwood1]CAF3711938.1 unnamed protein product [Rotaria sp. Silwood1]CAF3717804.1 unnamed protein product [Rotaria sp. Silwood1]CAF3766296.1 unnamed protein product [Rotaria sp. Silwood1]